MRTIDRLTAKSKNILSLIVGIIFTTFISSMLISVIGQSSALSCAVVLAIGNVVLYAGFGESSILATVCGLITSAQVPDCTNVNTNGLDVIIYIANKSEITSLTFTGSTLVCEAITFVAGKKFYSYEGKRTSPNAIQETKVGKLQTSFIHTVTQAVFKVTGAAKLELENMCNGLVVCMVSNKYQGSAGDSQYELFGYNQGLIAELKRDQSDADGVGTYLLTLKTPDGYSEPHLPYAFYKTSKAATDALIAGYLV
jgi:hypothetical protein